jgi:transcription elongation factor GreB
MSRAFVSDSDGQFDDDDIPEFHNPLPSGAKNYMTPEGAERLKSELRELSEKLRPEILNELSRLAGGSSNPERNEIFAHRRRLREIDRRITYLSELARSLEIVDSTKQDTGRVAFGATVTVEQEGEERSYRIVGVEESDPATGAVSWISPIAKALITKHPGETVLLKLPDGDAKIKILKVEYR